MAIPRFIDALGHGMADKRIEILRGIARSGSISQAARESAVSYKAAWQAIDTLTNLAGVPLVARAVGGAGGGGAVLTAQGAHLLDLAQALDVARQDVHARWSQREGGTAPHIDTALQRLSVRTSMRNQLPAVVASIATMGRIAHVVMHLGESGQVAARITQESAELLGLAVDMPVLALCKATAVRVMRAGDAASIEGNRLAGTAASVEPGEGGDEIAVALPGGMQLVGFAPSGSALRKRQRVSAEVDASAVVVALPG
ncbi:TOBE domain-containing protein [Variovorax ginsengisoli]|uniref:Molybdate transport system regulatory protein n=1 Tax=Variovorax ginsengisoli TaxID=363844 RepID=A0ABT9S462_9BURK|nr:TOBE domain-containing protein [Variovorax ginsengisoli]MDP9898142.1 molybdate transport system regulatory protein [Variovorax ginsengisoli]